MNFFQKPSLTWQKFRDFIVRPTHSRTMGIAAMFVLVAAVSLTVIVAQQQQTIRQRATDGDAEGDAKGYVLCGKKLACSAATVGTDCSKEGDNKCLSGEPFWNADHINSRYLACCNAHLYGYIDSACVLIKDADVSLYPTSCNSPTPLGSADYDQCGKGLTCYATTVATACRADQDTKCLSARGFDGDKINGQSLVCCNAPTSTPILTTAAEEFTSCTTDSECPSDGNECTLELCLLILSGPGICAEPMSKLNGANCTNGTCNAGVCIASLLSAPTSTPIPPTSTPIPPTSTPIPPASTPICSIPATPGGLACDIAGNMISWDLVTGALRYPVRVDAAPDSWVGTSCTISQNPGDVCDDSVSTNSRAFTFESGKTYSVWVHAVNDCGNWSSSEPITCSGPIPAGMTSAAFNITLLEIADNPMRKSRKLSIEIFDPLANNKKIADSTTDITDDPSVKPLKQFKGTKALSGITTSGIYNIKVKIDGYLRKLILSVPITKGIPNDIALAILTPGDIYSDNRIDILDYNIIQECNDSNLTRSPRANEHSANCKKFTDQGINLANADLNDNGVVDGFDFNIFIKGLSVKEGD